MSNALPDLTPLLIVGAGGFARETAAAVHSINAAAPRWHLLGFLDDQPALRGREFEGARVLGGVEDGIATYPSARVVVCVGRPENYFSRCLIVRRLGLPPERYATIIHPAASIAPSAVVGHGSVVLAGSVATAQCRIGSHVAVMPVVAVTHDDEIDDFATLASGVRLGGGVRIGTGAYVGAGALVREALTVGAWSLVGMGAVVTRPIPAAELWSGVPARRRGKVELPPQLDAQRPDPRAFTQLPGKRAS